MKQILLFLLLLILTSTSTATATSTSTDIGDFSMDRVNEEVAAANDAEYEAMLANEANGATSGSLFQDSNRLREPENYTLMLLRIIGYLVIITAIIFALAWGIRKFGVAGVPKSGGGNNMDIIETLYVGQNRGATLMRVADAVYLIGHTQDNIVLLEKIEGEKALELIASSKEGATIVTFKDAFNNFLGKMKK